MQLADNIVPCIDIGLTPSDLETTCVSYQTLGRKINEQDYELIRALGLMSEHVVEGLFTSSLKPQESKISREELGIPQESFVLVTVGGRLYDEVLDEFLEILNSVWEDDFFILFLGRFEGASQRLERFPKIKNASKVGMVEDILAVMENCDLYINPIRRGGGTSCVEAMYKGIPVVTTPFGDVATNAGEDFWVKDYEEMKQQIVRYHEDKSFYNAQSEKALKRVERLLDTDGEFVRILEEVDRRERQKEA